MTTTCLLYTSYDGEYHAGVILTGDTTGVTVRYFDNESGVWLNEAPTYRDAGNYSLTVELVNALGEAFSVQNVNVVIRQRALAWNLDDLKLDGITKVQDGSNQITGVEGELGVSGVLAGDSVNFTYEDYLAYMISNEFGDSVPAAIRFNGLQIDNANYALPQDALFAFRVRYIPGLPDSLAIPDETYDKAPHEPQITLSDLVEGVDYRVDGYENNVNAGTATVHVTGLGALLGQSAEYTFTIQPAGLPMPGAIADQTYTGSALTPKVNIDSLLEGVDFEVVYQNNVEVGTATAIVTGIGNYAGTHTLSFEIVEEPEPTPTPEPTPEPTSEPATEVDDGKTGSIVTDEHWQPEQYERRDAWLTLSQAEGAKKALVIEALPVLDANGEPVLREDGTPLYELRNLHLSASLLARLQREGYEYVLFQVGDAVLLIPLAQLEAGERYVFTLEPVEAGTQASWELDAFEQIGPCEQAYRVYVRKAGEKIPLDKVALWLGTAQEAQDMQARELALACEAMEEAALASAGPIPVEKVDKPEGEDDRLCIICVTRMPACKQESMTFAALASEALR